MGNTVELFFSNLWKITCWISSTVLVSLTITYHYYHLSLFREDPTKKSKNGICFSSVCFERLEFTTLPYSTSFVQDDKMISKFKTVFNNNSISRSIFHDFVHRKTTSLFWFCCSNSNPPTRCICRVQPIATLHSWVGRFGIRQDRFHLTKHGGDGEDP